MLPNGGTERGSEAAFRDLLTRYLNLVYSTAVRLVGGDTYLPEDVTQSVFIDLARAAPSLPKGVMVGGWLHRDTCYVEPVPKAGGPLTTRFFEGWAGA